MNGKQDSGNGESGEDKEFQDKNMGVVPGSGVIAGTAASAEISGTKANKQKDASASNTDSTKAKESGGGKTIPKPKIGKACLWPYPLSSLLCHGYRVLFRLEDISAPEVMHFLITGRDPPANRPLNTNKVDDLQYLS